MPTARRMPQNIDVLDGISSHMNQEGNRTEISGNLEVNGNLQVNQPVKVNVGSSLTEGYHVNRITTSYDYDTTYTSSKVIINQKNKDGSIRSTREFSFPPKGGTIIAGLYRHVIHATKVGAEFMIVVISSNNLKVTSLANLKTLLGATFEYPATGYYEGNATAMWKINQDVVTDVDYPSPTSISLTEFTFTDTVTSI